MSDYSDNYQFNPFTCEPDIVGKNNETVIVKPVWETLEQQIEEQN